MSERPIDDDDLSAYVDGVIEPERRRRVDEQLAREHELTRRIALHSAQRRALREALAPIAHEAIPDRLSVAHLASRRERRNWPARQRSLQLAAAAAVLFG